jgi:cysteinylglycine-S-conjugate dipeptidase
MTSESADPSIAGYSDGSTEIILMGVEEPQTLMHAPNESVHPDEIANMALTEALFLRRYASR